MKRDPIADLNAKIKERAAFNAARAVNSPENVKRAEGEVSYGMPAAAPYHDEADQYIRIVEDYFERRPMFCTDTCVHYHEASDLCQALDDGTPDICPVLEDLIQEEMRAMQDEHEAGYL